MHPPHPREHTTEITIAPTKKPSNPWNKTNSTSRAATPNEAPKQLNTQTVEAEVHQSQGSFYSQNQPISYVEADSQTPATQQIIDIQRNTPALLHHPNRRTSPRTMPQPSQEIVPEETQSNPPQQSH